MIYKEKILAKIESLLNEINYEPYTDETFGRIQSLKELKSYIDSLQEEPVSEDLEEAADKYTWDDYGDIDDEERVNGYIIDHVKTAFVAGANWKERQMIKDAIEGLVVCDEKLTHGYRDIVFKFPDNLQVGDKVKMIIVKEDKE